MPDPDRQFDEDDVSRLIGSWSDEPPAKPLLVGTEKSGILLGVELELECTASRFEDVIRYLHGKIARAGLGVVKRDGSLSENGIEVALSPASLEYHAERMGWPDICRNLDRLGCKSHDTDTCGLHVHVSDKERLEGPTLRARVAILVHANPEEFFKLARRSPNYYCRAIKKKLPEYRDVNDNRYEAVNFQNPHRVEFRLWRGTLKWQTILATLELSEAVVLYAEETPTAQVVRGGFEAFRRWVAERGRYARAAEYIEERLGRKEG